MSDNDFTTQYAIRLPSGDMFTNPINGAVVTWSEFDGAAAVYAQLAANAETMGMVFTGEIVYRYCTRFVSKTDQSEVLITELEDYLRTQGGHHG